jgi:hypothetical protein
LVACLPSRRLPGAPSQVPLRSLASPRTHSRAAAADPLGGPLPARHRCESPVPPVALRGSHMPNRKNHKPSQLNVIQLADTICLKLEHLSL